MNADFCWSTPTALIDTYSRLPAGSDGIDSRVNSVTGDPAATAATWTERRSRRR